MLNEDVYNVLLPPTLVIVERLDIEEVADLLVVQRVDVVVDGVTCQLYLEMER